MANAQPDSRAVIDGDSTLNRVHAIRRMPRHTFPPVVEAGMKKGLSPRVQSGIFAHCKGGTAPEKLL